MTKFNFYQPNIYIQSKHPKLEEAFDALKILWLIKKVWTKLDRNGQNAFPTFTLFYSKGNVNALEILCSRQKKNIQKIIKKLPAS